MKTEVKVLGSGCAKCLTLEKLVCEVAEENGFDITVTKVEDIMEIMSYNILATPALVINEKVVFKGGLPSKSKVKELIERTIHG